MTMLLRIDASARSQRSISRQLSESFIRHWFLQNPGDNVIYRDVGSQPPGFISQDWIAAAFTPKETRTDEQNSLLALSDQLIDELKRADIIVLATPMYNYGMPAALKAWVDQVVRVDQTFSFDLKRGDFPLEPLFSAKTLVLLTSCGEFGFNSGGIRANINHLEPHIRTVSKYLGVETTHELRVEYQEFADDRHVNSLDNAHKAIPGIVSAVARQHR